MASSPWVSAAHRIREALRPAEWVILLFVLYMSRFDHTGMRAPPGMPKMTLSAILGATLIRQGVLLRRLGATPAVQRYRRIAVPLGGALLVLVGVLAWVQFEVPSNGQRIGVLSGALYSADAFIGAVLLPTLPLGAALVGLGVHLGIHGHLIPAVAVQELVAGVGSTLRRWAPPVIMVFMYGLMSAALGNIDTPDMDPQLQAIDRWLCLGRDPIYALQAIVSRPVSEWLAFCYLAYVPIYALGFGAFFAFAELALFDELAFAVTACLALGFVGYTLVPARGPMFAEVFPVEVGGYYLQSIKEQIMDHLRAPRDCFPSLHTAIPLIFAAFAYRRLRPLFWGLAPVVIFIPLSCMYLRYHYLSDVVGGLILACFCIWLAQQRRWSGWAEGGPDQNAERR